MIKRNSSKKGTKKGQVQGPPVTALVYRGPTRLPRGFGTNDTTVLQFGNAASIASSAGGSITTVFDAYSQASSSADWTGALALWAEYRIISFEVAMHPWNLYNLPTTTHVAPMMSVTSRDNSTALSTMSATSSYESVQMTDPSTAFKRVIKMDSTGEADWIVAASTPSTNNRLFVKLLSLGNTASTTLYDYLSVTLVQFRGRQ